MNTKMGKTEYHQCFKPANDLIDSGGDIARLRALRKD